MKKLLPILLILISVVFLAPKASAADASLYLSPSSATYTVGSNFSVKVRINSGGEKINAAEGTISFNGDELSVVQISKSGSIFNLWTTEPTFSNSRGGNLIFGGGTTSGFTGISGPVLTITFRVKASASARVDFSSGAILAADGKGTNVLSAMIGGFYTLKPKTITPQTEEQGPFLEPEYVPPTIPAKTPAAPIISSASHPDPERWYSNNTPEFSWKIPSDITAVKLLINKISTAQPVVLYVPPIFEKELDELEDGVWYFHARFKNQYGWGKITHRKVLIDTKSPEPFEIRIDNKGDSTNPAPCLHFSTTDSLSGLEYYEVKIGNGGTIPVIAAAVRHNPFQMPFLGSGEYKVLIKAADAAGNSATAAAVVAIEPIEVPIITDFPRVITEGEVLEIKGTSDYPEGMVSVFIQKEKEEAERKRGVATDNRGNWTFAYPIGLEKGTYNIWAEVTDQRGAKSNPSEMVVVVAAPVPFAFKFGEAAMNYLSIIAALVVLIAGLVAIIFYTRYRISLWRKRLRKETSEVSRNTAKAFRALREEVEEQIKGLKKKRRLTKKGKEVRDKLQEALDISEEFISKEIKDLKEELE